MPSHEAFTFLQREAGTDFVSQFKQLLRRVGDLERGNNGTPTGWIAAPAMPATTVAAANTYSRHATVYVVGGTVTAITVDGITTGTTSGAVRVVPGATISITYSSAPTWKWYID